MARQVAQVPLVRFSDYTVGLISALPFEMAAVRAMMDECHGRPAAKDPADTNSYYLGRICQHNVVAACLPFGTTGNVSAAVVAAHMQTTFKSLRFGLAVGVGSGVPGPAADIRLGDVIVGVPDGGSSGVVQFDVGAAVAEGRFQPTGVLNKPPMVLLTAVTDLQAEHLLHGTQIQGLLFLAAGRHANLQRSISKPPDEEDRLFRASAAHVIGAASCNRCDHAKLVDRQSRRSDSPAVHYGAIASGSLLLQDGGLRDKLNDQRRVLCFESEAAGLMNNFPCLVIRGVCNYADSHQNDKWKSYAAIAAAAYAKELLSVISVSQILQTNTIQDTLNRAAGAIEDVKTAIIDLKNSQDSDSRDRYCLSILDWLAPADQDAVQQDNYEQREAETGEWLLSSADFRSWMATANATLYCPGIPGAGKTVMASIVINHLRSLRHSTAIGIAFFYCHYRKRNEQRPRDVVAVLLRQLCAQCPRIPEPVAALFQRHTRYGTRAAMGELTEALQAVVAAFERVFVVIDALDECGSSGDGRSVVLPLRALQRQGDVRLLVTARPHPALEQEFTCAGRLEIRARTDDLRQYLRGQMLTMSKHVMRDNSLRDGIAHAIINAADGMFLLAKLHVDSLRDKRTVNDIKAALKCLPTGHQELAVAYDKAVERIRCQRRDDVDLARRVFWWISHARQPLNADELQAALAVRQGDAALDPDNCYDVHELVNVCGGLVTEDRGSNGIRFIHHTALAYFESHQAAWIAGADEHIARACISYLSFCAFTAGPCHAHAELWERVAAHRLVSYAAVNWGHHARAAQEAVTAPALRFLCDLPLLRSACQLEYWFGSNYRLAFNSLAVHSSLHVAARLGLDVLAGRLVEGGSNVDEKDSLGRTPLSYAAGEGHLKAVTYLLSLSAVDVNSKDIHGSSPLAWGALKGDAAVVEALLQSDGIDVNSRCSDDRTPLHLAAERRHDRVLMLLLQQDDIQVDSRTIYGWTALAYAASSGHSTTVSLLLQRSPIGASFWESDTSSPLLLAANAGYTAIVNGFLGRADVRAVLRERQIRTLLRWAAAEQQQGVVDSILGHLDRDGDAKEGTGAADLLLRAAGAGDETVLALLLGRGVNPSLADNAGLTPLHFASCLGDAAVVRLLLDYGADVTLVDICGSTALSLAASSGCAEVIQLLLDNGANPAVADADGCTPVYLAAGEGHCETIRLLLGRGASPSSGNKEHRTPLHAAASGGHVATATLLLDHGADMAAVDSDENDCGGWTPLISAVYAGHAHVAQLLLHRGADVNAAPSFTGTALHVALHRRQLPCTRTLVGHGASTRVPDGFGRTVRDWGDIVGHPALTDIITTAQQDVGGSGADVLRRDVVADGRRLRNAVMWLREKIRRSSRRRGRASNRVAGDATYCLAHALLYRGDTRRARYMFEEVLVGARYHLSCSSCSRCLVEGMAVCRTCFMTSICEDCLEKYGAGSEAGWCSKHDFLWVTCPTPPHSNKASERPSRDKLLDEIHLANADVELTKD